MVPRRNESAHEASLFLWLLQLKSKCHFRGALKCQTRRKNLRLSMRLFCILRFVPGIPTINFVLYFFLASPIDTLKRCYTLDEMFCRTRSVRGNYSQPRIPPENLLRTARVSRNFFIFYGVPTLRGSKKNDVYILRGLVTTSNIVTRVNFFFSSSCSPPCLASALVIHFSHPEISRP